MPPKYMVPGQRTMMLSPIRMVALRMAETEVCSALSQCPEKIGERAINKAPAIMAIAQYALEKVASELRMALSDERVGASRAISRLNVVDNPISRRNNAACKDAKKPMMP